MRESADSLVRAAAVLRRVADLKRRTWSNLSAEPAFFLLFLTKIDPSVSQLPVADLKRRKKECKEQESQKGSVDSNRWF
jgi:hypothetical protein